MCEKLPDPVDPEKSKPKKGNAKGGKAHKPADQAKHIAKKKMDGKWYIFNRRWDLFDTNLLCKLMIR